MLSDGAQVTIRGLVVVEPSPGYSPSASRHSDYTAAYPLDMLGKQEHTSVQLIQWYATWQLSFYLVNERPIIPCS